MRDKKLFEYKHGEDWIVGKVYYDEGGANMFSGGTSERGYYFSVTPEQRGDHFITVGAFTGVRILIAKAQRYNAKELAKVLPDSETIDKVTQLVLQKKSLREGGVRA